MWPLSNFSNISAGFDFIEASSSASSLLTDVQGPWPAGALKVILKRHFRCTSDWRASWADWANGEGSDWVKGHTGTVTVTHAGLVVQRTRSVPSRCGPPHGSKEFVICAAPLCPAGKFSLLVYLSSFYAHFWLFMSVLFTGGKLLARPRQHRIRLLAHQQSKRLQHD